MQPASIKNSIAALIARIGINTGVNVPTGTVFDLLCAELIDLIMSDPVFRSMTFDETIYAFRLFAKGTVGGDKQDYGKILNIEYFTKIVQSYLRYRSEVFIKLDNMLVKEPETKTISDVSYYEMTEMYYQSYLSEKYNIMLWNPNCYDICVRLGWIQDTAYTDYTRQAKGLLLKMKHDEIMEYERRSSSYAGNYTSADGMPIQLGKLMNSVFDLTKIKTGEMDWLVKDVAKQLCLEELFKQFAIRGYKNMFVNEQENK